MKKSFIKTLMLVALLVMSFATYAVPADPKPITKNQPNGKTLTFYLNGDERMSWAVTTDGYTLLSNSNGNFVYAKQDALGNMVASDMLASNIEERSAKEIAFLSKIEKNIQYSDEQRRGYQKLWEQLRVKADPTVPLFPATGGKKNLLVVLVNFSDLAFTTDKSVFEGMCMEENWKGTGSIHDYFYVNSNGELDLQIDVVGPVTLPNTMKYYGGHKTYGQQEVKDQNMDDFVAHAVKEAADSLDLSKYDNDGDGLVDDIAFIYAGTPESSTSNADEIWPHSSVVYGKTITYDGVTVKRYTCSAEKPSPTIGTFCHEFGHALGLPDEYDTDYEQNGGSAITTGAYSVMCQGSYNNDSNSPCLWSAGQRLKTGWIDTVIELTVSKDAIRLPLMTGANDTAYRINIGGTFEFFMIEYRKKHGFDAYIPGEGMLIYHGQMNKINRWLNYGHNDINVNPSDRGWFIETANGNVNSTSTAAATFPGTNNINYFCPGAPNEPKLVNGTKLDTIAITDIGFINDTVMVFSYNSKTAMITTNTVTARTAYSMDVTATINYKHNDITIAKKGFVHSLTDDCAYNIANVTLDTDTEEQKSISATITGLTNKTQYYYRGFVEDTDGNIYLGSIQKGNTREGLGYATTKAATAIDSTKATLNGNLNTIGDGTFVEKGFVYLANDSQTMPTLENAKIVVAGNQTGDFSIELSGLQRGYTYYYRAYITNIYGTYYGQKERFQTLYPAITNNVISKEQEICINTTPQELTGNEPQGGFGNFTYRWEQKEGSKSWTVAEGTNNEANYQPSALSKNMIYRRVVISNDLVENTSNEVKVNVIQSVGGNITSSKANYTIGEEDIFKLTNYNGTILDWEIGTDNDNFTSLNNPANEELTQIFDKEGKFIYRVKVQKEQCEPAFSTYRTINVKAASIEDVEVANMLNITPNPSANGIITIVSDIANAQSIVITNTLGQVVYAENDVDLQNKTIDLQSVGNGQYIINIMVDNKLVAKKVIINK